MSAGDERHSGECKHGYAKGSVTWCSMCEIDKLQTEIDRWRALAERLAGHVSDFVILCEAEYDTDDAEKALVEYRAMKEGK